MPMHPLVSTLRNAYEGRSNDSFYPALDRVQALLLTAAAPDLACLDRHQLEERRNQLHVQLAAINDHLLLHGCTRNADMATGERYPRVRDMPEAWGSLPLDASDPPA